MATGTALGPLLGLAITAVGIIGMVAQSRARRARRTGTALPTAEEAKAAKRRADRMETERRMVAYLASRPRVGGQEE
jgi:hypothetical protein